jgi:hypothetical protein
MIGPSWRGAALAAVLLAADPARLVPPAQKARTTNARSHATPSGAQLQGGEALARAYDVILDGRFDQVEPELRRACGPAPAEACDVLTATAVWWRILLDPESHTLDREFETAVTRAIATTETWTVREPDDAEAWFYLGGAYAARVQWRVLRNEKLAAARDGKRIKQALERAVELDPSLEDAYFGIGMYKYYAAVAPTAAKILRFLLLLPGGDREVGLREMLRARNQGHLLQGEADYQLHVIYLWYERQTPRALELLDGLHDHYPGNPLFLAQTAEIQDSYQHDVTSSLATWRALLAAAREQRVNEGPLAEVQARLGIAHHLDGLYQTDHAIENLRAIVALKPAAPYASLPLAWLRLGEAHDRMGNRAAATDAYAAAIESAVAPDPYNVRAQAGERLRRAPDAKRAEAYRLSLDGFRRLERNDLAGAAAALSRSLALNAGDGVARYRHGRVLQAKKDDAGAIAEYQRAIVVAREMPPSIAATAFLDAARLHERAGRREQALAYYRVASTYFGGAAETHAAASRALTRLAR